MKSIKCLYEYILKIIYLLSKRFKTLIKVKKLRMRKSHKEKEQPE